MPKAGLLVQMDSSANMEVMEEYIKKRGLFIALYVDRASHFNTTRHCGLHYQVNEQHSETQIQRALSEFGIKIKFPQAKGRFLVSFRTGS